ncbi:GLPGLI family protein [Dokdonia genika]|uniref:GLPGLI family protein n=1 Tax=Dokdonia genika TaxID=308113 RepID=A0ABV9L4M7_9FLAO
MLKVNTILSWIFLGFNLFWSLNLYSQQAEIIYQATAISQSTENKSHNNNLKSLARYANKGLANLEFVVKTNDYTNIVTYTEKLQNDFEVGNLKNLALSIALDGKKIVVDNSQNIAYYEPILVDKIRSVSTRNLKWEILEESKNILGYECFKALGTLENLDEEGKLSAPAVAWFCPKLPMRGGPTAYATLPGLILEIENKKVKFLAVNIRIMKKSTMNIPEYKEGDILPHKEWNAYFNANNPLSRLNNKK